MATNYQIPDGRDLADIFTAGDAGIYTGFAVNGNGDDLSNDVGRRFTSGSTGITTGYRNAAGIDLGSLFGNDPWISQGYTKCTMVVGYREWRSTAGKTTYYYKGYGWFYGGNTWYGAISNTGPLGTDTSMSKLFARWTRKGTTGTISYPVFISSTGSATTSAVINGVVVPIKNGYGQSGFDSVYSYLVNSVGQTITIYLK